MPPTDDQLLSRLYEYAKLKKLRIHEHLGGGIQGVVCSTTLPSAVKAFKAELHYQREVAAYERIKERNITEVLGFAVPKPLSHHDGLMVIHMEIVRPPFVVDFASAGVDDYLYEYTPEMIAESLLERKERFEEGQWPTVLKIISKFRSHGIFLSDVKPGNITFA